MVDTLGIDITAEDLKILNSGLEAAKTKLAELAEQAVKSGKETDVLRAILDKTGLDFNVVAEAFDKAKLKLQTATTAITNIFKDIQTGTIDTAEGFNGWSMAMTGAIGLLFPLNKELDATLSKLGTFGTSGISVSNVIRDMTDEFKNMAGKIPGVSAALGALDTIKPFAERADQAKLMENTFLGVSAAAGDLGGTLRDTLGQNFDNLDAKMTEFNVMAAKVATSTGISTNQAIDYALHLKKIPGAMDQTVSSATSATGQLAMLDAVIKVSRGTMQDTGAVIETLGTIYRILGTQGEDALAVISRTYDVSNRIKMPVDLMKEYVTGAASAFRFLGDNTQGAMDIMSKMGGALTASGMGPAAVKEIVTGFVSGIENLNIAQKSFMAAKSGGPGGIKGGFQMDLMLKEGNLTGVADKVEKAMRDMFGGRIVKLEDAAKNEQAANQMLKQVELLKSFGLAKSDTQAYRVLEALEGKGGVGATKGEALEKAINQGNAMADRQTPIFNNMLNQLTLANNISSIHTGLLMRQIGVQGPIERAEVEASALELGKGFATSQGVEAKEAYAGAGQSMMRNISEITDKIGDARSQIVSAMSGATKSKEVASPAAYNKPSAKGMDFIDVMRNRTYGEGGEVMPPGVTLPPKAAPEVRETIEAAEIRRDAAERRRTPERMAGGVTAAGRPTESHIFLTAKFGEAQDFEIITNEVGTRIERMENGSSITGVRGSGK